MEYIKLEEDLRIGYKIKHESLTKDKAYTKIKELNEKEVVTYIYKDMNSLEFEELAKQIKILDILQATEKTNELILSLKDIFGSDYWEKLIKDIDEEDIANSLFSGYLEELEEELDGITLFNSPLYQSYINEAIENKTIDTVLPSKLVKYHRFYGYSQGDTKDYIILANQKEEHKLDKYIYYIDNLLNNNNYYFIINLYSLESDKRDWKLDSENYVYDIVREKTEIESKLKTELKHLLPKEYATQIDSENLTISIDY